MELPNSETLQNLMRAFAGETQARARYEYAAEASKTQGFPVLERLFRYTADQEKEHAELLWQRLITAGRAEVPAPGEYPVDLKSDMPGFLQQARDYERKEAEEVYPAFADTARREGFTELEGLFRALGAIEKVHADRFARFADCLAGGALFRDSPETVWICLNCGHVFTGAEPPAACPVCSHEQGYFIRMELSPFQ